MVGARRVLASAVHTYPHLHRLWSKLALHLIEYHPDSKGREAASKCLQGAIVLSRQSSRPDLSPEVSCLESDTGPQAIELSCLLTLSYIVNGHHQMAVKSASSAVHNYPHSPLTWSVLAAALNRKKLEQKGVAIQCAKLAMTPDVSPKMQQWINQQ